MHSQRHSSRERVINHKLFFFFEYEEQLLEEKREVAAPKNEPEEPSTKQTPTTNTITNLRPPGRAHPSPDLLPGQPPAPQRYHHAQHQKKEPEGPLLP
jgi:hypothetical protein